MSGHVHSVLCSAARTLLPERIIHKQLTLVFTLALASLTLSSSAKAQPADNTKAALPFTSLDRPSATSGAGVDFSAVFNGDGIIFRFDPHIEHMLSDQVGVMVTLPISRYVISDTDDVSGVGNMDVGAFAVVQSSKTGQLILRGSLGLPTASDDFASVITNLVSSYARIGDLVLAVPDFVVGRTSASYVFTSPGFVFRGDLGLDLPLIATEGEIGDRTPLARVSGGVAIGKGATKFVGELVNLFPADADSDTILHQLGFGFANTTGSGTLKGAVSFLADNFFEGDDTIVALTVSHVWKY